jgi:hypothetical protein
MCFESISVLKKIKILLRGTLDQDNTSLTPPQHSCFSSLLDVKAKAIQSTCTDKIYSIQWV